MSREELRQWAEAHAPVGCTVAKTVLEILDSEAPLPAEIASVFGENSWRIDRVRNGTFYRVKIGRDPMQYGRTLAEAVKKAVAARTPLKGG